MRRWRGASGELTGGAPDRKEGLYFGSELPPEHPRVRAGVPMHGANLFPTQVPALRDLVLRYLEAMTTVAQALLVGVARSLGLAGDYFVRHYTAEPTVLFRIFHYPAGSDVDWGVGEHTDYGLLTLLAQDEVGGLQVKTPGGWIDAPPLAGRWCATSAICSIA